MELTYNQKITINRMCAKCSRVIQVGISTGINNCMLTPEEKLERARAGRCDEAIKTTPISVVHNPAADEWKSVPREVK